MYSIKQIKKGIRKPQLIIEQLQKAPYVAHDYTMRSIFGHEGIDIMGSDWDNLIVLDGCRYDLFDKYAELTGDLRKVRSGGSSTREWLKANFQDKTFPDTVYVSGNAQLDRHGVSGNFFVVDKVWLDGWDEDLYTVCPDVMAERTLKANHEHPNKRIISHFVQPHYPFIGETGQAIEHRAWTFNGRLEEGGKAKTIWKKLRDREIDEETVWRAYIENLQLTLPHVERLCDELPGKTVVTSDHGNAFGEWGVYGHPHNRYLDCLINVPWLEFDGDDTRKKVTTGEIDETTTEFDEGVVDDRLSALGYK